MALFDVFKSSIPGNDTTFDAKNEWGAITAILVATAHADGAASEIETDILLKSMVFKTWFNGAEPMFYYKNAVYALQASNPKALVDGSVKYISEDKKATLFALCCETILVDGVVTDSEKQTLDYISKQLALNEDLATKIVEVLIIKAKDNKVITG